MKFIQTQRQKELKKGTIKMKINSANDPRNHTKTIINKTNIAPNQTRDKKTQIFINTT